MYNAKAGIVFLFPFADFNLISLLQLFNILLIPFSELFPKADSVVLR
jgi:hypothetical protein